MKIKVVEKYGAVVLELKGNILGGPDAEEFKQELQKLLGDNKKQIILDLEEVEFVNSSGLGMLISGMTTVTNGGGKMKLACLGDKIHSLLVITKLSTVFEIHDSVDEAVESFK